MSSLAAFLAHARELWDTYLSDGPSKVPEPLWLRTREAWLDFQSATDGHVALDGELQSAAERLFHLCERCATTTAGLSFVSGEAGLIPRLDLHAEVEASLELLNGV